MKCSKITKDEELFCFYHIGTAGSFYTNIVRAFMSADSYNMDRLISSFPELNVVRRYLHEPGYWDDLRDRWNEEHPTHIL